jgi:predicted NUDIX family NTP pyrophosphohydrolase
VRYFHMRSSGEARAQNEIDAVRWVPIEEALTLLSYPRDRELLSRLR